MSDKSLTHLDEAGRAHMVDVGQKTPTSREAIAVASMSMKPETLQTILEGGAAKGDVLGVARIAGIMATKKTGELIPLCHPLPLTHASVVFAADAPQGLLWIKATARCTGKTGVEMEAMTAASVAALTVYDMAKALDKSMFLERTGLLRKTGGKSGDFDHPRADLLLPPQNLEWR